MPATALGMAWLGVVPLHRSVQEMPLALGLPLLLAHVLIRPPEPA
ncbi:MAG TPA: hypothetical protein VHT52_11595 [Stellaceae bacterium]|nr:hypothetical protein [Stellaceae bacterium]